MMLQRMFSRPERFEADVQLLRSGTLGARIISEARREASRRNGRASRGPKTAAGKARSARNACRHGLSRPANLEPSLARNVAALAGAIAGPAPGAERLVMAYQIAGAAIDVVRVRRARCEILSADPLGAAAITRAAALDRYERRALSRRKYACGDSMPRFTPRLRRGANPRLSDRAVCRIGKTNPTAPMLAERTCVWAR
jgi:hypothetical protein